MKRRRDLTAGKAARDEGMARVEENNATWAEQFYVFVALYPRGEEVTGEDLRYAAVEEIGAPESSNAWGAAINTCIRRGYLKKTGRRTQMRDPKAHARMTDIYVTGRFDR